MSRLPDRTDTLASLPIKTINAGSRYYRVNGAAHSSSIFYSRSLENRWTPLAGTVGVCYMAASETGALAESVCRNAAHLKESEMITSILELRKLGMFELRLQDSVEVLDLTVSNLGKYRLDAEILSDYDKNAWPPYKFCPAWSARAIDLGLGGIVYRSRHHIDQSCLALFESGTKLSESGSGTLNGGRYLSILEDEFNWAII